MDLSAKSIGSPGKSSGEAAAPQNRGVGRRADGWLDEDKEAAIMGGQNVQEEEPTEWQIDDWEEDMARGMEYAEEGKPFGDGYSVGCDLRCCFCLIVATCHT